MPADDSALGDPPLDDSPLDDSVLSSLLQYDAALRQGSAAVTVVLRADGEPEDALSLGQRALQELEAAIPRRPAVMPSWAPSVIGRFQIQSVLGAGGFAVVYLAFDPKLDRLVALKIPRPHALMRPGLRRRFVLEAQAAARLDHPHIVTVYEAGEDRDLPYIACAWCNGPTLSAWLAARLRPARPRLAAHIVSQLASAVQFSHERGILHRDIKPGNVLLFPSPEPVPDEFPFIPRLSDFGLAKLLESGELDPVTSQLMGTPQYMAPELLQGAGRQAGIASDLYSLGAVLYCLLVGHPPYDAASTAETLSLIAEREPVPPELINPGIDRDLSRICLKCLDRTPAQRYPSAAALADDLALFLAGRPVRARRTSPLVRWQKWFRRRPLVGSLLLLSATLVIVLLTMAVRYTASLTELQEQLQVSNTQLAARVADLDRTLTVAQQATRAAETSRQQMQLLVFAADLQVAGTAWHRSDPREAANVLSRYAAPQDPGLQQQVQHSFPWHYLWNRVTAPSLQLPHTGQTVWWMQPAPDRRQLALCGNQGQLQLLAPELRYVQQSLLGDGSTELCCLDFSDDGVLLAAAGAGGQLFVWRRSDGLLLRTLEVIPQASVFGLRFLPGTHAVLVCGRSPDITRWDLDNGERQQVIPTVHPRIVEYMALSPDGQHLATAGSEGLVMLIPLERPEGAQVFPVSEATQLAVQFSADGTRLLTAGHDRQLRVWDRATGQLLHTYRSLDQLRTLTVTASNAVICGDAGGVVSLLQLPEYPPSGISPGHAATGWDPIRVWSAHDSAVSAMTTLQETQADGTQSDVLVTAARDGTLRRWSLAEQMLTRTLQPAQPAVAPLAEIADSGRAGDDFFRAGPWGLERWHLHSGQCQQRLLSDCHLTACCQASHSPALVLGDHQGRLSILQDAVPSDWLRVFAASEISRLSIDSTGRIAAALSNQRELAVVDLATRQVTGRLEHCNVAAITPDSRYVVTSQSSADDLVVRDTRSLQPLASLEPHHSTVSRIVFSPALSVMATVSHDRSIRTWDMRTWQPRQILSGHLDGVDAAAVSPDGCCLATGDTRGVIKLWDLHSGRELLELDNRVQNLVSLRFSADGRFLVGVDVQLVAHVFPRGPAAQPLSPERPLADSD